MFISFEGIDFCGKSTQVEMLRRYLTEKEKKVEVIREPGGTDISETVRNILLDKKHNKMFMETEIFLFSAARAQLVREKIRPYIADGIYVISDRFHDSTTAYQGYGRGISIDTVEHINNLAVGDTIPDITFIIDIPVEAAQSRKEKRSGGSLDRIEMTEGGFYERVRQGYLKIARRGERFRVIDGTMTENQIHKLIVDEIEVLEKREFA